MVFCTECGTKCDAEDRFCRECGVECKITNVPTNPKRQSVRPKTIPNERKDGTNSSGSSANSSPTGSRKTSPANSFIGSPPPTNPKPKRSSYNSKTKAKCAKCNQLITTSTKIRALGKEWHHECFNCVHCGTNLKDGFFPNEGSPYCQNDYEEMFLKKCNTCKKVLDGVYYDDRKGGYYHSACFKCEVCSVQLTGAFFWNDNKVCCEDCGQKKTNQIKIDFNDKCGFCKNNIETGNRIVAVETSKYHEKCFKCCLCSNEIGTNRYTFSSFDPDLFVCSNCIESGKAEGCAKCGQVLITSKMLAMGKKFHPQCFKCSICYRNIPDKEEFFIEDKRKEAICKICQSRMH